VMREADRNEDFERDLFIQQQTCEMDRDRSAKLVITKSVLEYFTDRRRIERR